MGSASLSEGSVTKGMMAGEQGPESSGEEAIVDKYKWSVTSVFFYILSATHYKQCV